MTAEALQAWIDGLVQLWKAAEVAAEEARHTPASSGDRRGRLRAADGSVGKV